MSAPTLKQVAASYATLLRVIENAAAENRGIPAEAVASIWHSASRHGMADALAVILACDETKRQDGPKHGPAAEIAALREALEPFAALWLPTDSDPELSDTGKDEYMIRREAITEARAALNLNPNQAPNDGPCATCGSTILSGRMEHHKTWCKP